MSEPEPTRDASAPGHWEREAAKKADRLGRAKRRSDDSLRTFAQVGVLAWMFVLPVLLAGWISHFALRQSSQRWLAVPLLAFGVVAGALLVRRKVRQLLEERRDDDAG